MVDEAIRQLPQRFAGTEVIKYIVMQNHVHLLIYNGGGHYLADMMRWLKSVTTNSYIKGVKEKGWASFYNKLWQRGYYDSVVRDQWEFDNVMRYIEENPVRWENECNASSFKNEGRIRRYAHTVLVLLLLFFTSCQAQTVRDVDVTEGVHGGTPLRVGADVLWQRECPYAARYALSGERRIAVVANQSSLVGDLHLVDSMLAYGFKVTKIFCPEHGFRGKAEAGARVGDENDAKTGLPIVSLYGKNKKPTPEQMKDIDAVIFDLQDVGCRFYTYISTLHYVMEACAERGIPCIVLDRPNPNCHYVDGPVLDKKYQSFIGMHPVPIVYGLTIGEYATMINGERWLKDSLQCDLIVVPMQNYRRDSSYVLPVAPSPNLQTPQSILLYPSLCLFEGTNISVGRGTETPFEVIGNPNYRTTYMESENGEEPGKHTSFTPMPIKGVSENPPFKGQFCRGLDLSKVQVPAKFDLTYLLWMYNHTPKDSFFKQTNSFEKLAGTDQLRKQIKAGMSEEEIRASWEPALSKYKEIRKKYLLYPDVKN